MISNASFTTSQLAGSDRRERRMRAEWRREQAAAHRPGRAPSLRRPRMRMRPRTTA